MMSDSQEQIRQIFSLNNEEKILDDFGCSIVETINIPGRLYLTEHYICFNSNLFGLNRKYSIPFLDIIELKIKKSNIEIDTKNLLKKKFAFTSFTDIQIVYKRLKSMCRSYNENISITTDSQNEVNPILLSDSEDSDDESTEIKTDNTINDNVIEEEEIKFEPIDQDLDFELFRKIININPKTFFEKYQTNKYPETSYKKYFEWVGDYSEIVLPDWGKKLNNDNPEVEKFQKIDKFTLALHGVPLINSSKVEKTLEYWVQKDGTYIIKSSSKSQGVPLSDCFLVESTLEFHPYMKNTKTIFRAYVRTHLIKSTLFKSMLISQTKKSFADEMNKWIQFIQEKGDKVEGDYIYKPKKKINNVGTSLMHGIEKENFRIKKEKQIVEFADFCDDIIKGIKKYGKLLCDYYNREFTDNKSKILFWCIFILFITMLYIIEGQNNEIRELRNGINELKNMVNSLSKIVLELKKDKQ